MRWKGNFMPIPKSAAERAAERARDLVQWDRFDCSAGTRAPKRRTSLSRNQCIVRLVHVSMHTMLQQTSVNSALSNAVLESV